MAGRGLNQADSRVPGPLYSALAFVVILVVFGIALTSLQPPPPAIAEFAPQAQQQIKQSLEEQTSLLGKGPGGGLGPGGSPSPTPSALASLLQTPAPPKVRLCVGNPPRQIEDPQSPPCVSYWSGDNGGATYQGVTGDSITIAVPQYKEIPFGGYGGPNGAAQFYADLENFFNKRFEFYGRKVHLVDASAGKPGNDPSQPGAASDPATDRAYADQVYKTFKPFASLRLEGAFGDSQEYNIEMARLGVPSTWIYSRDTDQTLAQYAPYRWQYPAALNRMEQFFGSWICEQLAGKPARYVGVGSPDIQGKTRKFGLLFEYSDDLQKAGYDDLTTALAQCNTKFAYTYSYVRNDQSSQDAASTQTNTLIQMRNAGVTSIALFVSPIGGSNGNTDTSQGAVAWTNRAQSLGYFPEWLINSYAQMTENFIGKTMPSQEWRNAFGLTIFPKSVPAADNSMYWATREVDPTVTYNNTYDLSAFTQWYKEVLTMMSGLQMAGPHLTPQTFMQGLQRTIFPNPDTPQYAGHVRFGPGGFSMTDDAAEVWWSPSAPDRDGSSGAYCYVDHGTRHRTDWRTDDSVLFTNTCDSGAG